MKHDWFLAWSFERAQELVSAINTLLIHAKLRLAGADDPAPADEVHQARERVVGLLERIATLVAAAEREQTRTVVGADPQLSELGLRFLAGGRPGLPATERLRLGPERLAELAQSDRPEDLRRLIPALEELRGLLETQAQADVTGILGSR